MYNKEAFKIKLSENIKKFRIERNLSQMDLSKGICEQSQISNLERGETMPTAFVMYNICKRLDISMEMLIEESMSEYLYKLDEFKANANNMIRKNEYEKLEVELNLSHNQQMLKDFHKDGASVYTYYRLKVIYLKLRKGKHKKEDIDYLTKQSKIYLSMMTSPMDFVKINGLITLNRTLIELGKTKEVEKLFIITDKILNKGNENFLSEHIIRNKMNKAIYEIVRRNIAVGKVYLEDLGKLVDKYFNPDLTIDYYGLQAFFYSRNPGEENKLLTEMYFKKAYETALIVKDKVKIDYYKLQLENIL